MKEAEKTQSEARASALRSVLRKLNGSSTDIEASACISSDGYNIAAVLGDGVDADRFGAMCASLLALAHRAAQEIQRGNLKLVLVEGEQGVMLLVQAGPDAILAVAAKPSKSLGMIFLEARKVAQELLGVLQSHP
ncbi:MAG: roadblock/LC7 domain-containing protein [Nitrosomonadales bacterium]|nr:roadblock/LC7 domain-containing protein [Nitrosomonadales bacterium]